MDFSTKHTFPSTTVPGATVTIRRLSEMQRAKRDSKIIPQTMRSAEIGLAIHKLGEPYRNADGAMKPDAVVPESVIVELTKLSYERNLLNAEHIHPATLRAGLLSIEGITYDGKPATADLLLENGPDALISEVVAAIDEHGGLSVEQTKNCSSPSDSLAPVVPADQSTTATTAAP